MSLEAIKSALKSLEALRKALYAPEPRPSAAWAEVEAIERTAKLSQRSPRDLEDAFDTITTGLHPSGPCTCGSDPEGSCRPCGQIIDAQSALEKIRKYLTDDAVDVLVDEIKRDE